MVQKEFETYLWFEEKMNLKFWSQKKVRQPLTCYSQPCATTCPASSDATTCAEPALFHQLLIWSVHHILHGSQTMKDIYQNIFWKIYRFSGSECIAQYLSLNALGTQMKTGPHRVWVKSLMPHRVGRAGLQEVDAWYRPYGLAHITQNIGIPYNILKEKVRTTKEEMKTGVQSNHTYTDILEIGRASCRERVLVTV